MCSVSACQFRMCKCLREAPKKHDSNNAETVAEDCCFSAPWVCSALLSCVASQYSLGAVLLDLGSFHDEIVST